MRIAALALLLPLLALAADPDAIPRPTESGCAEPPIGEDGQPHCAPVAFTWPEIPDAARAEYWKNQALQERNARVYAEARNKELEARIAALQAKTQLDAEGERIGEKLTDACEWEQNQQTGEPECLKTKSSEESTR